jgi:signal transduction protein with GAF and PtsI domain
VTGVNREQAIVAAFTGFADKLVGDFDVLDVTIQLTEDCARVLDIAAAGLLLTDAAGVLHVVATTSEQARSLEVFQIQRDEGPCLDCFHGGEPVSVPSLQADADRWPRFVPAAAEQGFRSVHAIPLRLRRQMLGALGLFGNTEGALSDADLALARAFADVSAIALAQHQTSDEGLLPTLQSTVASRGILEMAKGVVADTHQVSLAEASVRLRRYAADQHLPLTALARAVVTVGAPHRRELLAALSGSAAQTSDH